jgi:hypothetical protein
MRLQKTYDDGLGVERLDRGQRRRLNREQHSRRAQHRHGLGVKLHAFELRVGVVTALAGAALHVDGGTELQELGRDIGCQGDPCLVGRGFL